MNQVTLASGPLCSTHILCRWKTGTFSACMCNFTVGKDLHASNILNIYGDCETYGFLKLSYMHINGLSSMCGSACTDHVTHFSQFSPYARVLTADTRVC